MANPIKGEVPLKLADGRAFTLVADFNATLTAESLYGKPAHRLAEDAQAGFLGAIHALLYGMLKSRHPQITAEEVGGLLQDHGTEVIAAIQAAGAAAENKAGAEGSAGGNGQAPPERRVPTGKRSGRSGAKRG